MKNIKINQVIEKCHKLHVGTDKSRGNIVNKRISEGEQRPEESVYI